MFRLAVIIIELALHNLRALMWFEVFNLLDQGNWSSEFKTGKRSLAKIKQDRGVCVAKVFVLSASFFPLKRHTGNGFLSWKYCYVYVAHIPRERCYVLFISSFTVRLAQYRLWSCFQPHSHRTADQSRAASEEDPILCWLITASNCMICCIFHRPEINTVFPSQNASQFQRIFMFRNHFYDSSI